MARFRPSLFIRTARHPSAIHRNTISRRIVPLTFRKPEQIGWPAWLISLFCFPQRKITSWNSYRLPLARSSVKRNPEQYRNPENTDGGKTVSQKKIEIEGGGGSYASFSMDLQ